MLNFFEVQDKFYIVDMPGYGYAKGSLDEALGWRKLVEEYFKNRKTVKGVILIMDIRRDWDDEEVLLQDWLEHYETPYAVLLNKADKLSRAQIMVRQKAIGAKCTAPMYVISSAKKTGLEDIKNLLEKEWGS
jgi:GTP-binding protein